MYRSLITTEVIAVNASRVFSATSPMSRPQQSHNFTFDLSSESSHARSLSPNKTHSFFGLASTASQRHLLNSPQAAALPTKRTETIKNELGRVLSKLQDTLKNDGSLRLPHLYYAIRLLSRCPIVLDEVKRQQLGVLQPCLHIESCNLTTMHARQYSQEQHHQNGLESDGSWYEHWYLLRYDMAACASASFFYVDHLAAAAKKQAGPYQMKSNTSHPLSYHKMLAQLSKCFPEYVLLPSYVHVESTPSSRMVSSSSFSSALPANPTRYMQCFTAYPKGICQDAHHAPNYSKSGYGGGDDSADEEKDERIPVDAQGDRSDGQKSSWTVDKGIDCKYLHFTSSAKDFYVYTTACDAEHYDVHRYTLSLSRWDLHVEDMIGTVTKTAQVHSNDKLVLDAATISLFNSAACLASSDMAGLTACTEVKHMLSYQRLSDYSAI
jgi:hypothetical protein